MVDLLKKFYTAFNELDAETMASCYHNDIVFEDPAFGILKGEKAGNMWQMLCSSQKGKDFKVIFYDLESNTNTGTAKWEAFYNFSKTGRKVHNKVTAKFEFKDGKIIKHTDDFNLHTWSKQAMGFKGLILGGTGFFKKKLQQQTNFALTKFENSL